MNLLLAKKYVNTKFIFVTGGVFSSLGKGLTAAALAVLLKQQGIKQNGKPFRVRLQKSDPYLNVDPGTMSPFQHGEVFVTDDGGETDLDLGHYERFTGDNSAANHSVSAGRIYQQLLEKERRGEYLGKTVQVIPHVTNLIKQFILNGAEKYDFNICEIGGTVGDIEGLPFFETIRQLGNELPRSQVLYLHVTFVPYVAAAKELKTKPTQHSVKELRAIGIQPNVIMCRSEREITKADMSKIALFCNVRESNVIAAPDVKCTYEVPLVYHRNGLDREVLSHFRMPYEEPDLSVWHQIMDNYNNRQGKVKIAVVGKYNRVKDAYKSLIEAFEHAGIHHRVKVQLEWVNARTLTDEQAVADKLSQVAGIMVPGGFGEEGVEGKVMAIKYAREHNVPFFGICYGMQLAVVEASRNLLGFADAASTEYDPDTNNPVIGLMTEWLKDGMLEQRAADEDLGGTMRLGSYDAKLKKGSKLSAIYHNAKTIKERHRHRYEVNANYLPQLEQVGLEFSGISKDGVLPEAFELNNHPWFIGVQFHPELKSRPFDPHPLFCSFIAASIANGNDSEW